MDPWDLYKFMAHLIILWWSDFSVTLFVTFFLNILKLRNGDQRFWHLAHLFLKHLKFFYVCFLWDFYGIFLGHFFKLDFPLVSLGSWQTGNLFVTLFVDIFLTFLSHFLRHFFFYVWFSRLCLSNRDRPGTSASALLRKLVSSHTEASGFKMIEKMGIPQLKSQKYGPGFKSSPLTGRVIFWPNVIYFLWENMAMDLILLCNTSAALCCGSVRFQLIFAK